MTETTSSATAPSKPARRRHLRNVLEDRRRRHFADVIQLSLAFVGLVWWTARSGKTTWIDDLGKSLVSILPRGFDPAADVVYFLGGVWIAALVAIALIGWRRYEAAGQVVASSALAWVTSGFVGWILTGTAAFSNATIRTTPDAPVTRVAVVVAVTVGMAPFVPTMLRRLGLTMALLVGMASVYLGYREGSAVFAGFLIGWAASKVVQLVRGTPEGLPTVQDIHEAMAELGVPITDLEQVSVPFGGAITLDADGVDGRALSITAAGRDQRDSQILVKVRRWLVFKDSGPRFAFNRLTQLEHEAYVALLAADHGVQVPRVEVVGMAGPGTALLVTEAPEAASLRTMEPDSVTDAVLDAAWAEINKLHAIHIAHGALTANNVLAGDNGQIWLSDFAMASSAAPEMRIVRDRVEFFVSSALIVGDDRAIAAIKRALPVEALTAMLPILQPAALDATTRKALKGKKGFLKSLTTQLADTAGSPMPQLEQLRRVSPATLFMALGSFIAVYALLAQVGNPAQMWDTVKQADWFWVAAAGAATLATNVTYGFALVGCAPVGTVRFGPAIVLEFATSFGNVAVPGGVGTTVFTIRFLQRLGIDVPTGVTVTVATNAMSGIVQVLLFVVCLPFASSKFSLGKLPSNWPVWVLLAILAVALVIAVVFGVPAIRKRILPVLNRSKAFTVELIRSPRRLFMNFAGNLGSALLSALCLALALKAFGGSVPLVSLIVVNIGVSTIASMVPVPGGLGVGALGLTGALVALGVPNEVAVPAVLTQQLLVIWLPVLPGWFCTRALMRRDYL